MRRELGMFGALVAVFLIISLSNSAFFDAPNVTAMSRELSALGIMAIGITFVIITGGIDLSIGSIVGLTGVIIAKISSPTEGCFHQHIIVGIAIALSVALLIGLIQGLLITRLNLQSFIVTLGFMLLIRGISQVIVHGGNLSFGTSNFPEWVQTNLIEFKYHHANGAVTVWPILSCPMLLLLVVIALATYLLHFTVLGRYIYAIGGNRDAAEYSGIPVKNVEMLTYILSAGLAGVAGVSYAAFIGQMSQNVGIAYELNAIAAAVLGGVSLRGGEGTIFGVMIGSALFRVIYTGIDFFTIVYHDAKNVVKKWTIGTNWVFVIIGSVILVAVILDQVVHIVQARRRTRSAGAAASPPAPPSSVMPPQSIQ